MSKRSISIYIHIPFCQKKCPYCDFNSYATDAVTLQSKELKYVEALVLELKNRIEEYALQERVCGSIFFGGGTPSLLSVASFKLILDAIYQEVCVAPNCEVTVEMNPKSVAESYSLDTLIALRDLGVNRISVGAQSFNMQKLKFLGRWHSNEDVIKTVELVRDAGIDNYNLDLMFGVREELLSDWECDIRAAIALSPRHVSAYMLTMEPGTEFGKRTKKGEVLISDEDTFVTLYESTRTLLAAHGYEQYEISNYAAPDFLCKHNVHYWEGGEYVGIGAGAHSFIRFSDISGLRYSNTPSPDLYVFRIQNDGSAKQVIDEVSRKELLHEYLLFGLRMNKGILATKKSFDPMVEPVYRLIESGKMDHLLERRYIEYTDGMLRVSPAYMRFADELSAEVTALLP